MSLSHNRIDQLIEMGIKKMGIKGFEFDNDEACFAWHVMLVDGEGPEDGKMIARRAVLTEEEAWDDYFEIPYGDLDACDELYLCIVEDFVDCYGQDLHDGTAGELLLFDDYAGRNDDGMMQLLSFFGKTYGDFFGDIFFVYGQFVEGLVYDDLEEEAEDCAELYDDMADADEEDDDEDDWGDDEEEDDDGDWYADEEDFRMAIAEVKSVLRHCCSACLEFYHDDDEEDISWQFAVANGEVWYGLVRRVDATKNEVAEFGGDPGEWDRYEYEFGHAPLDDEDAMGALRDAVQATMYDCSYCLEVGDPFGLIGLKEEDFVE